MTIVFPQDVIGNVGNHCRLPAMRSRSARPHARTDHATINGPTVFGWKARSGAVSQGYAVRIEQQYRTQHAGKLLLHGSAKTFQNFWERRLRGDLLQNALVEPG